MTNFYFAYSKFVQNVQYCEILNFKKLENFNVMLFVYEKATLVVQSWVIHGVRDAFTPPGILIGV